MKKLLFTMILVMLTFVSQGQTVPKDIVDGFKKGDARKIAAYFHDNLEMQILDESHVTSKNQATRILQDFFKKYPPSDFQVNYEGTEQDSKYGHSTLTTRKGSFRVSIYFMEGKQGKTIYSLSIEKI
jgi:hypothetical protein